MDDLHEFFEDLGNVTARTPEAHLKRLEGIEAFKSKGVPAEGIYLYHSMIENESSELDALTDYLTAEYDLNDLIYSHKEAYQTLFHAK